MRTTIRWSLLCSLIAGMLPAQTTWIVDDSGGAQFRDIAPAVNAANAGDTIIVRPGVYNGFAVLKGLRVLADPGAFVGARLASTIEVLNIPAGQTVLIRGLSVSKGSFSPKPIWIHDNRGHVHLEGITSPSKFLIERSQQLSLYKVSTVGSPGLHVIDSRVLSVESNFRGLPVVIINTNVNVGARLEQSHVTFVGGIVEGGSDPFNQPGPASGILMVGGLTELVGADTSILVGGGIGTGIPTPAITTSGGTITIDPAVKIQSVPGAPSIAGSATVVQRALPSTRASSDGLTLTATVHAQPGTVAIMLVGLTRNPRVNLSIGDLWLGTPNGVLAIGVILTTGSHTMKTPIPPVSLGTMLTLQSLLITSTQQDLSTATVLTID